jgi:A/G-specific adenine glycosylase
MTDNQISTKKFQQLIWEYYRENKRHFPWRETHNPYLILVSELMLQQTQTDRVAPKYSEFLKCFPDFESLARAPLSEVLKLWSGLGYNRRAKFLHQAAQQIVVNKFPNSIEELKKLPGIGPYTAAALYVFVYNKPAVVIETNIRRVFIHEFFTDREMVTDMELIPVIEKTIDTKNPREWYYALMDYGAMLGRTVENPNRKSKHYTKQSKFEGSRRQLRGKLMRVALEKNGLNLLHKELNGYEEEYIQEVWEELVKEGMV